MHPQGETFCFALDEQHWVIGGASSNGAVALDWASQTILQKNVSKLSKTGPISMTQLWPKLQPCQLGQMAYCFILICLVNEHRCGMQRRAQVLLACAKSPCWTFSSSGGGRHLFQFKTILEDLKQLGGPVQEIRATGGFADSPVFRQIMADVLGETLSFTDSTEASALGAVLLGWQGLGQLPNLQAAAQQVLVHETVTPRADQLLVYQELYPVFKKPNKF